MRSSKYFVLCVASSCVWSVLALILGYEAMGEIIWGGIMASPIIGVAVGYVYRPVCKWPLSARVVVSLATLYLAVTAFGLAIGLYDAFVRDIPNRITWAVVIQAVLASLWGITFTGFVAFLWPLSFLNHTLLCRVNKSTGQAPHLTAGD